MILQQYLASEPGVDYRFYVVGDEVVAAMKRSTKRKTEFRANIALGGKGEDYRASREEKELALRVARAIGLDVCGIDFVRTKDGLVPIEVNINAHFKGIEKATGVNVAGKVIDYCLDQAKKFEEKKESRRQKRTKKLK
jgi:ribosomal protein S6--L-glutamate ligase